MINISNNLIPVQRVSKLIEQQNQAISNSEIFNSKSNLQLKRSRTK